MSDFCRNCMKAIPDGSEVCPFCGADPHYSDYDRQTGSLYARTKLSSSTLTDNVTYETRKTIAPKYIVLIAIALVLIVAACFVLYKFGLLLTVGRVVGLAAIFVGFYFLVLKN